ncbi:hypothetical protein CHLNCDRAFT_138621 [Chlorella variabilis]|uniref:Agenet domain-containing protein n=1 Tax=Chlorella variabilis TaxID=554065 RepID=E1ZNE7_CHLVA|nr:hypothetical protein CHLNCDRAFT_138621 [Chlorella variabilis]EFN52594.1 hypothetical protein CHLNCDRAFT_138621 [Chlorella variabilis]|eukprot:XP_005844696.1 hypothetical protein CHLNCDRAFT_138621 [Chlorella variabilis]
MKWREGDAVEVGGDPEEEGWEGSWWGAVLLKAKKKRAKVRYDEMLDEGGKDKLVEEVDASRLRPKCPDDSLAVPLSRRMPGDPIDCWHEDGWWEGYVHRVFDDHLTVYFPASQEEYDDIYPPTRPRPDPEAHRVRTGKNWDAEQQAWVPRPRRAFKGARNLRTGPPAAGAVALAAARRGAPPSSSSSSSEDDGEPLLSRLSAQKSKQQQKPQQQQQQKQQQQQQKQQQQQQQQKQQQQAPGASRRPPAAGGRPPSPADVAARAAESLQRAAAGAAAAKSKMEAAKPAAPAAAAAPALERLVSEPAEASVQAAKTSVVDLIATLDDSEEDEGTAAPPPAAAAPAPPKQAAAPPAASPRTAPAAQPPPAAGGASAPAAPPGPVQGQQQVPAAQEPMPQKGVGKPPPQQQQQAKKRKKDAQPDQQQQQQLALERKPSQAAGKRKLLPLEPADLEFKTGPARPPPQRQLQRKQDEQQAQQAQQAQQQPDSARAERAQAAAALPPAMRGPIMLAASASIAAAAAAGANRKAAPAAKQKRTAAAQEGDAQLKRQLSDSRLDRAGGGAGRAAGGGGGGGGGGGLFIIPKRVEYGSGGGPTLDPSPRSATAAARPQPGQKRRRAEGGAAAAAGGRAPRWRDDDAAAAAAAPSPRVAGAPPPIIPKVQQRQQRRPRQQLPPAEELDYDPDFPTTFCLDNLPACVSSLVLEEALAGLGLQGFKSVHVVSVPLDSGDRMAGYAVLRFQSPAWAHRQLRSLCILTPTCPVPRPLLLHEPRIRKEYGWGPEARLPGHFPLDYAANQHFAQPSSIEFDLALDWRQLLGVLAAAKQGLCREQAGELAQLLAAFVKESGQPEPSLDLGRLLLPGEAEAAAPPAADPPASHPQPLWRKVFRRGRAGAAATPPADAAGGPASSCVWLSGVPVAVGEDTLKEVFRQFGFPQKAVLVLDPVTRRPSSHAVLWMESQQRARDLNLRDMVFMLNGTPRAVDATLAVPGPPRGSQSTYDRALRCVFGADDSELEGHISFVEVPDELLLAGGGAKPAERAAISLRRLLLAHRKEQAELAREKQVRQAELDERQRKQLNDERFKLGRLAQMQLQNGPDGKTLLQYLLERHGLRGLKVYRNKDAGKLAAMAAAEQRRRAMGGTQRDARGVALAPLPQHRAQAQRAG